MLAAWLVGVVVSTTTYLVVEAFRMLGDGGETNWAAFPIMWLTVAWWALWITLIPAVIAALFCHAALHAARAQRLHDYLFVGMFVGAVLAAFMSSLFDSPLEAGLIGTLTGGAAATAFWRVARPDLSPEP